jgi:hypothetical protein
MLLLLPLLPQVCDEHAGAADAQPLFIHCLNLLLALPALPLLP